MFFSLTLMPVIFDIVVFLSNLYFRRNCLIHVSNVEMGEYRDVSFMCIVKLGETKNRDSCIDWFEKHLKKCKKPKNLHSLRFDTDVFHFAEKTLRSQICFLPGWFFAILLLECEFNEAELPSNVIFLNKWTFVIFFNLCKWRMLSTRNQNKEWYVAALPAHARNRCFTILATFDNFCFFDSTNIKNFNFQSGSCQSCRPELSAQEGMVQMQTENFKCARALRFLKMEPF